MANRVFARSEFSTPHEAEQADNEALRDAVRPDVYGDKETFIVRVLTRPMPLSANDFKAVMGAIGSEGYALAGSTASRIVFMGRIMSEGTDAPSPHSTIPDPCDPALSADPGCAAKIISWHTKFFSEGEYEGLLPSIGDRVKVTIMPGQFKYNLQYAFFTSLDSITAAATDDRCKYFRALFDTSAYNPLGDVLPTVDPPVTARFTGGASGAKLNKSGKCAQETDPTTVGDLFSKVKTPPTYPNSTGTKSKMLQMFGNNNWRYQQPHLQDLKWLIEVKGVTDIIKMNGNTGNDISYSHDKNYGVCVSHALEQAYAESLHPAGSPPGTKAKFHYIYAQSGFVRGRGYVKSLEKVMPFFDVGNTLIHCTHGADRTGFMVAAWLSKGANAQMMVTAPSGKTGLPRETTAQASPWQKTIPGKLADRQAGTTPSPEDLWSYTKRFNSWETYLCKSNNGIPYYTRRSSGKIILNENANWKYAKYLEAFYPFKSFCKRHPSCYGAGACSNPEAQSKLGVAPGASAKSPWGGGKFESEALAIASGEKCTQSKCNNTSGCPGREGKDWGWVSRADGHYATCGKHPAWKDL